MAEHFSKALAQDEIARARRIASFFNHPDRTQRHRALEQLVGMGEAGVPALVEALASDERLMRAGALRALMRVRSPESLPGLMGYLEKHQTEIGDNRAFAMQGISAAVSPEVEGLSQLFFFLQAYLDDPDHFVRAYAHEALGRLGDARALPLVERGTRDKEPFVAEKAVVALGALATAPVRTAGADMLMSREEVGFALQSGESARRSIGMNELLRRTGEGEDMTGLVSGLLLGPNRIGRQSALEAISRLKDPRLLPLTLQALKSPNADDDLRSRALRAVSAYGPEICHSAMSMDERADLLDRIKRWLVGPDLFVRSSSVAALGSLQGRESLELLLRAAHDENSWVRGDAVGALSHWAGERLVPYLDKLARLATHALTHMPKAVTGAGGDGAGSQKDLVALQERLLGMLIETSAAKEEGDEGVVLAGFAALAAGTARIRLMGLEVLSIQVSRGHRPRLTDGQVRLLAAALTSSRRDILLSAVEILEAWLPVGSGAATADLIALLRHGDEALALRVVPLLGIAGDIEARGVLMSLSNNDNARIAEAAQRALQAPLRAPR